MFDDGYAFTIHPWFQATGSTGFHVYIAARAYAAELGLSSIPVKAMTTLVPSIPRPVFADTVKALIAAGAFVRLEDAIEVVHVPGSHVRAISQDPVSDGDDDERRLKERTRKAQYRARRRLSQGQPTGLSQGQNGTLSQGQNGTNLGQDPGTDLRRSLVKSSKPKKNPPTPLWDTDGTVPGTSDGTSDGTGTTWVQRIQALVDTWNEHCGKLPKVRAITSNRARAYRLALEAHPDLADWAKGAAFLTTQGWAMGGDPSHPNWFATLDYLVKAGKLAATLEKADALANGLTPQVKGTAAGRVAPTPGKYAHLSD